jgi:hypothetical protein
MQQRKRRMRLLSPTDPVIQRYFTELSAAGGQHYTIPTVTIGASDDFELEFTGTFSPNGFWLMADTTTTDTTNARLLITLNREVFIGSSLRATIPSNDFSLLTDGKIRTLILKRTNNSLTVIIDGTGGVASGAFFQTLLLNSIATKFGGNTGVPTFNGYLSDVKISINNTLVRHYPLDDSGETNVARELVSGADGTRVNLTQASTKLFTKDGNTWVSGSTVLEIAP